MNSPDKLFRTTHASHLVLWVVKALDQLDKPEVVGFYSFYDCTKSFFVFHAVSFLPFGLHGFHFCHLCSQFSSFLTARIPFLSFMQSVFFLLDCMDFLFVFHAVLDNEITLTNWNLFICLEHSYIGQQIHQDTFFDDELPLMRMATAYPASMNSNMTAA